MNARTILLVALIGLSSVASAQRGRVERPADPHQLRPHETSGERTQRLRRGAPRLEPPGKIAQEGADAEDAAKFTRGVKGDDQRGVKQFVVTLRDSGVMSAKVLDFIKSTDTRLSKATVRFVRALYRSGIYRETPSAEQLVLPTDSHVSLRDLFAAVERARNGSDDVLAAWLESAASELEALAHPAPGEFHGHPVHFCLEPPPLDQNDASDGDAAHKEKCK